MTLAPHRFAVRVYWEDTDAGGIVYHASHVRFFERGRTEFLRDLGVLQSTTAQRSSPDALLFAVRRLTIDYLKPAYLDDLLTVETELVSARGPRLEMAQRLIRDGMEIARAAVTVAALDGNGRPRRLPPELAARLAP